MNIEPVITPNIVAEHGLTADEYAKILEIIGREPNITELGIFSAMWNEHCSYKSSRLWLKTLPTEAPWVICGPGENAGVVDIGDGQAAVFKMESHNHPSFIEPHQGAATGVGGIMRDVFTMGARPIANMNVLHFGAPNHPKTSYLVGGVVSGIGGYGNCMGVPTVGGETTFHASYNGNNLVNAMCVGIAPAHRIFYAAAGAIGAPVIYVGSKTGRDGIHGASMASAEFNEDTEEKRPTVQVGDPFTEKLLLEACLELMATDSIIGIQDMGAAGLTCSSVEMADKGNAGMDLDLDAVPQREAGMTAYELMLSESQERMLMVIKPEAEDRARAIFEKWELDFAVVGHITDSGRLIVRKDGEIKADLPVSPLSDEAPLYDRPWSKPEARKTVAAADVPASADLAEALITLMASPDLASRQWIWEQYDHLVMGRTVQRPGGDAAVIEVPDGNGKGLAITTDCTPRYCEADPFEGGKQAVAEAYRNLSAVGAQPLASTDCLNFGNPERPGVMGTFVNAIKGLGEACEALSMPIVSGNVSLYNETNGKAIQPTPVIGAIGLIPDLDRIARIGFGGEGHTIVLLGDTSGNLGSSLYLREIAGREDGAPPLVDLDIERRHGNLVRGLITDGTLTCCHDVSDGGIIVALTEMALAANIGCAVDTPSGTGAAHGFWFGEDQARYLVAVPGDGIDITSKAAAAGVSAVILGATGGDTLTVDGGQPISLRTIRDKHEGWLPSFMAGAA
ncbi:MAG: phosphoribosylformylglycinamidine synthase II [Rhodospirillaceae bacterium]|nr:phosphoribosylformylglycinamidine synthase II [Rhodospirillaceae bacterium]|tara:strand:- start:4923 stop:7130 length:2208 start_codon:yes stop_codon:yes gene_type:complete